jgi:hypothetical protein
MITIKKLTLLLAMAILPLSSYASSLDVSYVIGEPNDQVSEEIDGSVTRQEVVEKSSGCPSGWASAGDSTCYKMGGTYWHDQARSECRSLGKQVMSMRDTDSFIQSHTGSFPQNMPFWSSTKTDDRHAWKVTFVNAAYIENEHVDIGHVQAFILCR